MPQTAAPHPPGKGMGCLLQEDVRAGIEQFLNALERLQWRGCEAAE